MALSREASLSIDAASARAWVGRDTARNMLRKSIHAPTKATSKYTTHFCSEVILLAVCAAVNQASIPRFQFIIHFRKNTPIVAGLAPQTPGNSQRFQGTPPHA